MKRLQSKRAEGYIDTVVCVIAAMMVIVLALHVFSFLTIKQDMDYFAKEIIDTATIYGRTSKEVLDRYQELCEKLQFLPSLDFTGAQYYSPASGKVQLGDTIMVTVSYQAYINAKVTR